MAKTKPKTKKKKKSESAPVINPLYFRLFGATPSRSDIRRAKILESAILCISELGIENTNFETVGKRAGMNRAHVQYYFSDRDDIVKAAIRLTISTAQEITIQTVTKISDPRKRLEALVTAAFDWAQKYPEQIAIIGLIYYYATYQADYRIMHTEIRNVGVQRIAAILKGLSDASEKSAAKIADQSLAIHRLITGALVETFTTNQTVNRAEVQREILRQIAVLIGDSGV